MCEREREGGGMHVVGMHSLFGSTLQALSELLYCCSSWYCLLFSQRIDMERATCEAMDPNLCHKPRLLSEEELPSWLINDEDEVSNVVLISHMQINIG